MRKEKYYIHLIFIWANKFIREVEQDNIRKHYGRRTIRLKEYDYTNPNWYYITIYTNDKICVFGNVNDGRLVQNRLGKVAKEEWLKSKMIRPSIELDYCIMMLNHIHGIIRIESRGCLKSKYYKLVIPTKVGIHFILMVLDSNFHGNDTRTIAFETASFFISQY